jgi:hypothetical protein
MNQSLDLATKYDEYHKKESHSRREDRHLLNSKPLLQQR